MAEKAENIYAQRDIEGDELRQHYMRHIDRMTREDLFSKSAIAAELAWRDKKIQDHMDTHVAIADKLGIDTSETAQADYAAKYPDGTGYSVLVKDYVDQLLQALHDAINRPMGVVPKSAERFYKPSDFQ